MLMGKAWIRYDSLPVGTLAFLFCDKSRDKFLSRNILIYEINENN
jgi:hypothetical protein